MYEISWHHHDNDDPLGAARATRGTHHQWEVAQIIRETYMEHPGWTLLSVLFVPCQVCDDGEAP